MEWLEISKTAAQLGLIPVLITAIIILWRKWWSMVDKLVTTYEAVIEKKDQKIEDLTDKNEKLGEKRLEEYRSMVNDYRDTLETTNARDAELASGQKVSTALLQQLVVQRPGGPT